MLIKSRGDLIFPMAALDYNDYKIKMISGLLQIFSQKNEKS
jgi:hypothetical protein